MTRKYLTVLDGYFGKKFKNKSLILGLITTPLEGPLQALLLESLSLDSHGLTEFSDDLWLDLLQLSLAKGLNESLPERSFHLVNASAVAAVDSQCCWRALTSGCRQLGKLSCWIYSPPLPFQSGRCNHSNSPAKN